MVVHGTETAAAADETPAAPEVAVAALTPDGANVMVVGIAVTIAGF